MVSISRFEQEKPRETYKAINNIIDHCVTRIEQSTPIMCVEEAVTIRELTEVMKMAHELKEIFLSGK